MKASSVLLLPAAVLVAALASPALSAQRTTKAGASAWLEAHAPAYKQKYLLSCEIALIRQSLGLMGVAAAEDEILSTIPRDGKDPEKFFVCDDLQGGRRSGGVIHWDNYGAHPPVVVAEIEKRLAAAGRAGLYEVKELRADDARLRELAGSDARFLGAVVWVVGHPERWGAEPPVNERGMVLGEHVRFLDPVLAPDGRFRIWDPENGKLLVSKDAGAGRSRFDYRVVGIFSAK